MASLCRNIKSLFCLSRVLSNRLDYGSKVIIRTVYSRRKVHMRPLDCALVARSSCRSICTRNFVSSSELSKQNSGQREYEMVVKEYEAGMTEEEVDAFVSEILSSASEKDVMVKTVNRHVVKDIIDDMLLKGWSPHIIRSVFLATPNLLTKSKGKLGKMIDSLGAFGFTNEQAANLMTSGVLADFSENRLMESMDTMMKSGMRDGQAQVIVSRFPELLSLSSKDIDSRVAALKALFKTDDIVPLVVKAPRIFLDDWSKIADKFNYVFSAMGVKQRQMVNSKLFRYPLDYVKTRHTFVLRAGFYVKPRRDDDPVRMTNPKLKDILDTSDEEFAQKFGNMTLLDYKAFAKMMKNEFVRETLETDSDDETEDNEKDW